MPELCRFYGIVIRMYPRDHGPPHFHAWYSGQEVSVNIEDIAIIEGQFPTRPWMLVAEWASLHQEELQEAWNRIRRRENPEKIDPLP